MATDNTAPATPPEDNTNKLPRVLRTNRDATPRLYKEMVAAGVPNGFSPIQGLAQHPDLLTAELGINVYTAMLYDAQVNACVTFWKAAILEDGVKLTPPVNDPDADGFQLCRTFIDEASHMFDAMPIALDDVMWDMLNSIVYGLKVAETIWEVRDNRLDIARIKVKPVKAVSVVVDQFMNLVGIIGAKPGQIQTITDLSGVSNGMVLPLEKFALLSFRPEDADPRGKSILRPAYDAWWRKRQIIPEYLKFLSQFAGPSIIGYTPEDASLEDAVDEDGNATSPEEGMLSTLVQWRNGSAAAFPGGSSVDIHKSEGEGLAFTNAIASANLEITKSILGQELATEQSKYMARAAAEVHQDVLDTLIRQGKQASVRMLYHQLLVRWIRYNYGDKYVPLTPRATLGTVENRDRSKLMMAVAALERASYFAPEQKPEIDKLLGFPVRSKSAIDLERKSDEADVAVKEQAAKPPPAPVVQPPQPSNNNDGGNNNNNNQKDVKPNDGSNSPK